jgi:hypothetical protein
MQYIYLWGTMIMGVPRAYEDYNSILLIMWCQVLSISLSYSSSDIVNVGLTNDPKQKDLQ